MKIPPSIQKAVAFLKTARCPEEIFGEDPSSVKDSFRDWAKVVHEDKATDKEKGIAHEGFILLTKWMELAEIKIANKTYGDLKPVVLATFKTKTASYSIHALFQEGDIADLYEGQTNKGQACWVKVNRSPKNNDLMKSEADILASLPSKLKPEHAAYFPNLLDSFEAQNGAVKTRVNVFARPEGMISVQNVLDAYPKGIDIKDAAWIFNRMLDAAHLLHVNEIVHASITPDRFLIDPKNHTGTLVDFCYSLRLGGLPKAYAPKYKNLYPPELFTKKTLDYGADLYMIACIMNLLIGGIDNQIPAGTPVAIAGLLRSCWLGKAYREKSAKVVHSSFKEIRDALGWKKEFRDFPWPPPAKA